MTRLRTPLRLAAASLLVLAGNALAQTPPATPPTAAPTTVEDTEANKEAKKEAKKEAGLPTSDSPLTTLLDSAIDPENPAFTLLGVAASDIVHPESPQSLAIGLLNGLDQRGNFQSGVAMEFSPVSLFIGRQQTLKRYQDDYYGPLGLISRLRVSLAVAGGSEKDKSARASIGFVWSPFDGADHNARGTGSDCVDNAGPEIVFDPNATKAENAAVRKATLAEMDACMSKFLRTDRTFGLQFSFAPLFISESGKTDDFKARGYTASTSASIGLTNLLYGADPTGEDNKRAMLILTGTYRKHETIPDPATSGAFLQRNRWTIGGRFEVGKQNKSNFGIEAVYQNAEYALLPRDRYLTVVGTVDIKVTDTLWLGLNAGTSSGRAIEGDDHFIGTRFRWAFNKKSTGGLF